MNQIILGDNLDILPTLPERSARLIYIDPPFNTGKTQRRRRMRVYQDSGNGGRQGFGGRHYTVRTLDSPAYSDSFDDFLGFVMPRIERSLRCLTPDGSLFVHLDHREVHYVKVALDSMLGRDRFMNEIVWAYDYGARSRDRWPSKHDTILWYALNPDDYVFNYDEMDRIPYMAPGLVTAEKAERGKTPTDVWWHTIVPTNSKEKTGYPTQKPLGILNRIVKIHTQPGDAVLDFFAGSGTTGEAAATNRRDFILIDNSPEAAQIMAHRLARFAPNCLGFSPAAPGPAARTHRNPRPATPAPASSPATGSQSRSSRPTRPAAPKSTASRPPWNAKTANAASSSPSAILATPRPNAPPSTSAPTASSSS